MLIERLSLENFKSFGGRVDIDLVAGVSIIVGPNGSGKSNLLDALRWVFGEIDVASLRAPVADELAFRGSEEVPAAESFCVTARISLGESGVVSATRGWDVSQGEFFRVDGESMPGWSYAGELRQRGVPAPLFTTIRQGDVGRLLFFHPEERTRLLVELLARPDADGGRDLAMARSRLLAALAGGAYAPAMDETLRALGLPRPDVVPSDPARQLEEVERLLEANGSGSGPNGRAATVSVEEFGELRGRVETRARTFFDTLMPGGEIELPPVEASQPGALPGVAVAVRFPGKPAIGIEGLSGGQQALVGLCFALGAFLETPSPAVVLDEVEPALDDALVRRLSRLLHRIGEDRQVIVVSHQRIMRHTARHVMHVERRAGMSRIGLRYDPQTFRGPGAFAGR